MSSSYQKLAGLCGILAGIAGLVYLIAFLVLKNPAALLPALALLLVGILSSATIVALYFRVREVDAGFALWGLVFGLGGAGGAAIHSALVLIVLLASGVLQPVWYLWLGWYLWRGEAMVPATMATARSR